MNKKVTLMKVEGGYYLSMEEAKKRADGSTHSLSRATFIADDEFEGVYRELFLEHFKMEHKKLEAIKAQYETKNA